MHACSANCLACTRENHASQSNRVASKRIFPWEARPVGQPFELGQSSTQTFKALGCEMGAVAPPINEETMPHAGQKRKNESCRPRGLEAWCPDGHSERVGGRNLRSYVLALRDHECEQHHAAPVRVDALLKWTLWHPRSPKFGNQAYLRRAASAAPAPCLPPHSRPLRMLEFGNQPHPQPAASAAPSR